MKKIIFSAIMIIASTLSASSQSLYNNDSNHAYFGARLGLDISSASEGYGIFSNGAGFNLGAVYNMPLYYMNFYLEPGAMLFYDTFGLTAFDDETGHRIDGSIRNFGLRIPIVAGFRFDVTETISVSLFTGPQINFGLSAREKIDGEKSVSAFNYGFRHTDLQWKFGAGCAWDKWYVEVSGAPGLTKVFNEDGQSFRRNIFNISIGRNF